MKKTLSQYAAALCLSLVTFSSFAEVKTPAVTPTVTTSQARQSDRVLVVMTNHSEYPSRSDSTGLWLTELTHFYELFSQAGIPMDFVSPKGGVVPLDERSLGWLYSDNNSRALLSNPSFANRLRTTRSPAEVNPQDYAAIFYTGGHGTMWDFKDNADLKRLAEEIYNRGGIVSSVCHGAAGLLSLQHPDGSPLIAQRRVTGFSNLEEKLSGIESQVPFALQTEMEGRQAVYEKSWLPFSSFVVIDGRFITGQNPGSSKEVAQAVLSAFKALP